MGAIPGWGTKILQATQCSQNLKNWAKNIAHERMKSLSPPLGTALLLGRWTRPRSVFGSLGDLWAAQGLALGRAVLGMCTAWTHILSPWTAHLLSPWGGKGWPFLLLRRSQAHHEPDLGLTSCPRHLQGDSKTTSFRFMDPWHAHMLTVSIPENPGAGDDGGAGVGGGY